MIKVDHSACLALGGTFDPCYILTITAVPTQMGPTMNKRNAALIQSFLADILSVPPGRGVLKFEAVQEENMAINGSTLLGEIERQEKQQAMLEGPGVRKPTTTSNPARMSMSSFNKQPHPKTPEDAAPANGSANGPLDRVVIPNGNFSQSTSTPGLFELPGEVDRMRPSTSHGPSLDGLRANSFTSRDSFLREQPQVKARPKSMVADPKAIQDQLQEYQKQPLPPHSFSNGSISQLSLNQSSAFPSMAPQRGHSFTRHDSATRLNGGRTPPNFSQGARHSKAMITESRSLTKDSYLGSLVETPVSSEPAGTNKDASLSEKTLDKADTTANTASTLR